MGEVLKAELEFDKVLSASREELDEFAQIALRPKPT
jgi:hypothetical protein